MLYVLTIVYRSTEMQLTKPLTSSPIETTFGVRSHLLNALVLLYLHALVLLYLNETCMCLRRLVIFSILYRAMCITNKLK